MRPIWGPSSRAYIRIEPPPRTSHSVLFPIPQDTSYIREPLYVVTFLMKEFFFVTGNPMKSSQSRNRLNHDRTDSLPRPFDFQLFLLIVVLVPKPPFIKDAEKGFVLFPLKHVISSLIGGRRN